MKQSGNEILKKDIALLLQKHTESIIKNEIGAAFNIMKDIDLALDQLSKITDIEVENEQQKSDGWYNVLKFFIETRQSQLIKLDHSSRENETKHRDTGKTTAIARLSSDYNIPIYCSQTHSRVLRDIEKELNLNAIIITDLSKLSLRQYSQKGIILVDELTDISKIDIERFIIIGFTQ